MSKKNNIENLFKEKMLHAEVTPPAHVKHAIDNALDFPKSNLRYLKKYIFFFVAALSLTAAYFYFSNDDTTTLATHKTEAQSTLKSNDNRVVSSSAEESVNLNATKETLSASESNTTNIITTNSQEATDYTEQGTNGSLKGKDDFLSDNAVINNTATPSKSSKLRSDKSSQELGNNKSTQTTNKASDSAGSAKTDQIQTKDGKKSNLGINNSAEINANSQVVNLEDKHDEEKEKITPNQTRVENSTSEQNTENKKDQSQTTQKVESSAEDGSEKNNEEDGPEEENEKPSKKEDKTTKDKKNTFGINELITGYAMGGDISLQGFKNNQLFTTGIKEKMELNYKSILAYQLYGQVKAFDHYNLQLGLQLQNAKTTYTYDSTFIEYTQNTDTSYVFDSTGVVIIDTNYTTTLDSMSKTLSKNTDGTIRYFHLPISIGRTFVLNPYGDENLKLTTNLGADLRFTSIDGEIPDLTANPFTVNFIVRNTFAYSIGDLDIILPIQINYNPKSRLMFEEIRIDPKTSITLGIGLQYNF